MTPSEDVMCHRQSTMKADAMNCEPSSVLGPDDLDSMPYPAKEDVRDTGDGKIVGE